MAIEAHVIDVRMESNLTHPIHPHDGREPFENSVTDSPYDDVPV